MVDYKRYIASGFRQDMEELFSRFTTNSQKSKDNCLMSLRFSWFCQKWREMGFSFIFKIRLNDNDLREFVAEIYSEVLPNLCEDQAFERRVFALYLLYSLFAKQPKIGDKSLNQKIRISFEYLEHIRELIQRCQRLQQLDVCYVWYKMLALGAVEFVHTTGRVGFDSIRNSRSSDEKQSQIGFLYNELKTSLYRPIDELSDIHQKYQTLKQSLSEDIPPMKELNLIEDNVFELSKEEMKGLVKPFTANGQSADVKDSKVETNGEIGDKRKRLKEKAFSFGAKTGEQNVSQVVVLKKSTKQRGRPKVAKLTHVVP